MGAPVAKLETVVIVRPLKVLAAFLGVSSLLGLIICGLSTSWITIQKCYFGLFNRCFIVNSTVPESAEEYSCRYHDPKAWLQAVGALTIICFVVTFIGVICICVAMALKNPERRRKLYRVATYFYLLGVVCILVAAIVFPSMFLQEINERGRDYWKFGWAYGIAWGVTIFLFGGAVFLLFDSNSEEVYYSEKTYVDVE